MNTVTASSGRGSRWTPLGIAALVLGFMVWWPLGMAVLAYILWGGSVDELAARTIERIRDIIHHSGGGLRPGGSLRPTGNAAFDAYREETLRRLEEEQREFEEFVTKLRQARDREEFERFMAERNAAGSPAGKGRRKK